MARSVHDGRPECRRIDRARLLEGAIDIHVHSFPTIGRDRSTRSKWRSWRARASMRAIVLKNHYESTAGLAFMVRKGVPGIEVFGGIDLNLTVGGINPAAVEHMTRVSGGCGRIVWMPTFDAENQVRYFEGEPAVRSRRARNGELLPEVQAGDRADREARSSCSRPVILRRRRGSCCFAKGRRQGVQHMVVTHAMNPPISMTVAQMQEAAKLGAFIEFVGGSLAGADAADADESLRRRDSGDRTGVLHPVVGPRPAGQCACRPTASAPSSRRCAPGVHRAGSGSDGEAEPGPAARFAVSRTRSPKLY